jgi:hypothetical protein
MRDLASTLFPLCIIMSVTYWSPGLQAQTLCVTLGHLWWAEFSWAPAHISPPRWEPCRNVLCQLGDPGIQDLTKGSISPGLALEVARRHSAHQVPGLTALAQPSVRGQPLINYLYIAIVYFSWSFLWGA